MKPIHIVQALIVVLVWGCEFRGHPLGFERSAAVFVGNFALYLCVFACGFFYPQTHPAVVMVDRLWFAQ